MMLHNNRVIERSGNGSWQRANVGITHMSSVGDSAREMRSLVFYRGESSFVERGILASKETESTRLHRVMRSADAGSGSATLGRGNQY